jgi:hypothetical protein
MTITLSANWNGNWFLNNFGIVCLHNPEKYKLGNRLEVMLKNQNIGIIEVVAVKQFHYKNITDVLGYINAGKPAFYLADCLKRKYSGKVNIKSDTLLNHVVCQYKYRNIELQTALLKEWWTDTIESQSSVQLQLL